MTNESEAMEVWLHARREYNCGRGFADNEAAIRVIATALEARDAKLKTVLDREADTIRRYDAKLEARDAEKRAMQKFINRLHREAEQARQKNVDGLARIRELEGALKPFAKLAAWIERNQSHRYTAGDEVQIEGWAYTLGVGQLIDARAILTKGKTHD